jgi:O-antigen/teichoic acid export membrane protein
MAQRTSLPRRSPRINLAILAFGELLTRAMSFLAFAHLARTLQADGFGKLEFVLAWVMFGVVLIESGFQTIGARDVAIDPASAGRLVAKILPLQLGIAVVAVLACGTLQAFALLDGVTSRLLFGYSLSLLATPWFLSWVFQGQQRMTWVAVPQVLRQLFFLVASLWLVRSASDILWLPYIEGGSVLVAAAICLSVYLRGGQTLQLDNPLASPSRVLMADAATIGASQMLWFVRMYLPIILLKFLSGDEAVGHFGAAHRIVNVYQVCVTVYWVSFFPQLSQHAGRHTLQSILMKSLIGSTSLMLVGAMAIAVFAPPIIDLAFGRAFAASTASTVLAIMVWRVPIIMFRSHARQALFVSGFQNVELVCSLMSVAALAGLACFATVRYGVVGLAIAATIVELAGAIATWIIWMYRWRHSCSMLVDNNE